MPKRYNRVLTNAKIRMGWNFVHDSYREIVVEIIISRPVSFRVKYFPQSDRCQGVNEKSVDCNLNILVLQISISSAFLLTVIDYIKHCLLSKHSMRLKALFSFKLHAISSCRGVLRVNPINGTWFCRIMSSPQSGSRLEIDRSIAFVWLRTSSLDGVARFPFINILWVIASVIFYRWYYKKEGKSFNLVNSYDVK